MFNLEDFKKYGVAIRRDGERVSFIAHIPGASCEDEHVLSMDDNGNLQFNGEDGLYLATAQCGKDLIDVERPMLNVSFSVPEPLSEEPCPGDAVYVLYGGVLSPSPVEVIWGAETPEFSSMTMERGFVWKTMEEAQAAADILKKGFRQ